MKFSMIAAVDARNGIGKDNTIPWYLPQDLRHFQSITVGNLKNVVIMGRNTWESIPEKFRPLKNRLNIVITSLQIDACDYTFRSIQEALDFLDSRTNIGEVFVIGGQRMYEEGISHPDCEKLYITHLENDYDCTVFFPEIDEKVFHLVKDGEVHEHKGIKYRFVEYGKI